MKLQNQEEEKVNYRVNTMLENCSDEHAIVLAESIAAHRLAGIPTHHLEDQLIKEITRMKVATRVLFGRTTTLTKESA